MKKYRNILSEVGISEAEIDKRINDSFETMFFAPHDVSIYREVPDGMGYMEDTGNIDARTEGMSYGMMMAVQMDRKDVFDRIWKWSMTNMYLYEGRCQGYFAWSCAPDGTKNAYGPAPDGEEYFAMALIFASHRWGDGKGIYNYSSWARHILRDCIHRNGEGDKPGQTMWDLDNHLIKFVVEVDFTDPSYHLPHFYDLFAENCDERDSEFWKEAASASREFLHHACHPVTGLCADYSAYSGKPMVFPEDKPFWNPQAFYRYYSDSYRTVMNMALDTSWNAVDPWQCENAAKVQAFFESLDDNWDRVPQRDGTLLDEKAMHPVAVIASNAAAPLASWQEGASEEVIERAKRCVLKFWNTPLRTGNRRYYDNCLYFFALLMLSGRYRQW